MDERGKREHREISEDTVAVVQVGERGRCLDWDKAMAVAGQLVST